MISPRHAKITVLGIPLYNADFQFTLQDLGSTGTTDNFNLTVKTSQQVPTFLLDRLMPGIGECETGVREYEHQRGHILSSFNLISGCQNTPVKPSDCGPRKSDCFYVFVWQKERKLGPI